MQYTLSQVGIVSHMAKDMKKTKTNTLNFPSDLQCSYSLLLWITFATLLMIAIF